MKEQKKIELEIKAHLIIITYADDEEPTYINSTTRNHVFKYGEIKITIPKKLLK